VIRVDAIVSLQPVVLYEQNNATNATKVALLFVVFVYYCIYGNIHQVLRLKEHFT